MEIILLERIEKLGQMGDLVKVKPGYARNFLLPQGKALRATEANKKRFEEERAERAAANDAKRKDAEKLAKSMEKLVVVLVRAASEMGSLYGSASSRDIAAAITEAGFEVGRNQVDLNLSIKTLGLFPVRVVLHPEVSTEVVVNIARSKDEAAEQQRIGRAIITDITELERQESEEAEAESLAEEMFDDPSSVDTEDLKVKDPEAEAEDTSVEHISVEEEKVEEAEEAVEAKDDEPVAKKVKAKKEKQASAPKAEAKKAVAKKAKAVKPKAKKAKAKTAKATKAKSAKAKTKKAKKAN